jgi:hypothetical protein
MSGIELAESVRRRWPALPVLLTSGYSALLADEGSKGFPLQAKPYSAQDLQRALARLRGTQWAWPEGSAGGQEADAPNLGGGSLSSTISWRIIEPET